MERNIEIFDATPAVADVLSGATREPIHYTERKEKMTWRDPYFRNMHEWAMQTHGYQRVAEVCGLVADYPVTVRSGKAENDDNVPAELQELGAVVAIYLILPISKETQDAGGGAHASVIGLSADGCRAFLLRGEEWRPTKDGLYPWPCDANAL